MFDSHCHAWNLWPYQPAVPDPESRGSVEELLFEMDQVEVARAAVVCAALTGNPDNNGYVHEAVGRYPDRLVQFADVDCMWSSTYHRPGAAGRLKAAIRRYHLRGFTHYVKADDDGAWYLSAEGLAFFSIAESERQLVSLAIPPRLQPTLRKLAARFPALPFLCHHLGGVKLEETGQVAGLDEVLASAELPNIYVKLSGLHYAARVPWDYPHHGCGKIIRDLYSAFGPERLCWGSDYPVVRKAMTYRQSLEAFRVHCEFAPESARNLIFGENMERLLAN